MAHLGDIGILTDGLFVNPFAMDNACSISRVKNPIRAILTDDQPFAASFEQNFCYLAGKLLDANELPLVRKVNVLQRDYSQLVGTMTSLPDGRFFLRVPTNLSLDVHILAIDGDGCDVYLPYRSPECGDFVAMAKQSLLEMYEAINTIGTAPLDSVIEASVAAAEAADRASGIEEKLRAVHLDDDLADELEAKIEQTRSASSGGLRSGGGDDSGSSNVGVVPTNGIGIVTILTGLAYRQCEQVKFSPDSSLLGLVYSQSGASAQFYKRNGNAFNELVFDEEEYFIGYIDFDVANDIAAFAYSATAASNCVLFNYNHPEINKVGVIINLSESLNDKDFLLFTNDGQYLIAQGVSGTAYLYSYNQQTATEIGYVWGEIKPSEFASSDNVHFAMVTAVENQVSGLYKAALTVCKIENNSLIKVTSFSLDQIPENYSISEFSVMDSVNTIAWCPNSNYIAVGTNAKDIIDDINITPPFLTVYQFNPVGNTLVRLPDPPNQTSSDVTALAFDHTGLYLAVGYATAPYFALYRRYNNSFSKLINPSIMPTGKVNSLTFSKDGAYLAVAHNNAPYLTMYNLIRM